jgi:hypothetical protein
MALATYSDLKSAIADWLERGDLTAVIPNFIALAEADINARFNLRDGEQNAALTATPGSRFITLPTGFREAMNLWINWPYGRGDPLRFVMPELLVTYTSPGIPLTWCIDGTNIAFERPCLDAYSMTLRQANGETLSDANPTNLLLTLYPNVYLFGALKEAADYLKDDPSFAKWSGRFDAALSDAKSKEGRQSALVTLSTEPGVMQTGNRRGFNITRGW